MLDCLFPLVEIKSKSGFDSDKRKEAAKRWSIRLIPEARAMKSCAHATEDGWACAIGINIE